MIIDTHAHLDFPDFSPDLDEVIARAKTSGVTQILTVGTTLESSRRALALSEKYEDIVRAVVGVHPCNVDDDGIGTDIREELRQLAAHPLTAALGETGLDYYHLPGRRKLHGVSEDVVAEAFGAETTIDVERDAIDGAIKARQADLFRQHLEVANETGLNVVIHQRDSWEDTLGILVEHAGRARAVFHCFTGTLEQANALIMRNHMVSYTGIITFKNAKEALETAAALPPDAFMLETDCPYLAPIPYRGKRCEPSYTRQTAEALAAARGITLEQLAATTTANAHAFFRLE